ncbi:hypothetical protein Dimus_035458 [Dionaea muscipula]
MWLDPSSGGIRIGRSVLDAQVDVEEPVTETPAALAFSASPGDSTTQQKEQTPAGVDPSGPSGHIPESVMNKLQAEFERARANRIQLDLEKAQAENTRLLACSNKPDPNLSLRISIAKPIDQTLITFLYLAKFEIHSNF